jgi:hypothetical protein
VKTMTGMRRMRRSASANKMIAKERRFIAHASVYLHILN